MNQESEDSLDGINSPEELSQEEKDHDLFENYSKIKKITKFCEIMVSKGKQPICRELHDEVVTGETNYKGFVEQMRTKFKTNKKLTKVITFVDEEKGR